MTRTQKLGLCTWLPEDPVCLAEVNDNFSRLDSSGARALRQAEAGLIALGGVMSAQAHQGGHAVYSDCIQADAFQDMEQIASYTGTYCLNKCAELLTSGLADGSVAYNGVNNAFHASDISYRTTQKQAWVKLFYFYPDAFGTLTSLKMQSTSSASSDAPTVVKLGICDSKTQEVLYETALGDITKTGSTENPVIFDTNYLLDPNRRYVMMLWVDSSPLNAFSFSWMRFTITPVVYAAGSVCLTPRDILAGCTRAEVLLRASTDAANALLRFGSGEFTALTASQTLTDRLPGGEECTFLRFGLDIPAGAQTVQLKLELPSTSCKLYDTALVLL